MAAFKAARRVSDVCARLTRSAARGSRTGSAARFQQTQTREAAARGGGSIPFMPRDINFLRLSVRVGIGIFRIGQIEHQPIRSNFDPSNLVAD
jgi:hypothetical protein